MSIKQQSCVEAMKLALWHEAMAKEPNRNQAKREKHEATAKFIRQVIARAERLEAAVAEQHKKQERGEPVDLSSFLCGYAQIKDGQYKFANMRTVELLTKDEFGPIYAIPEELIDSLYTHPYTGQPKRHEWVGLTQNQINSICEMSEIAAAVIATELLLKENNT